MSAPLASAPPNGSGAGSGALAHRALLVVAVAVLLALPGPTSGVTGRLSASVPERDAVEALRRAAAAPAVVGYRGVQLVATWDGTVTTTYLVDVDHVPGRGSTVSVRPTADGGDGPSRERQWLPDSVDDGALALLDRSYVLRLAGAAAPVGRPAAVVEAGRPDGRPAARFWVDRATGLVLRREVYDRHGRLVRTSAFLEIRIERPDGRRARLPEQRGPTGPAAAAPDEQALRRAGWWCPRGPVAGLQLVDAREVDVDDGPALHLTYSDGLSRVSVFEQRGRLGAGGLPGFRPAGDGTWVSEAPPRRVVWASDGLVYTAVADGPAPVLADVTAAFPGPSEDGAIRRVERGMTRVGSWFNPFA